MALITSGLLLAIYGYDLFTYSGLECVYKLAIIPGSQMVLLPLNGCGPPGILEYAVYLTIYGGIAITLGSLGFLVYSWQKLVCNCIRK